MSQTPNKRIPINLKNSPIPQVNYELLEKLQNVKNNNEINKLLADARHSVDNLIEKTKSPKQCKSISINPEYNHLIINNNSKQNESKYLKFEY